MKHSNANMSYKNRREREKNFSRLRKARQRKAKPLKSRPPTLVEKPPEELEAAE